MKYGITVSTYETSFGPIIYRDGKLKQNIAEMSQLGYDGVDLFVNRKTDEELLEIKEMFREGNIEINTYLPFFWQKLASSFRKSMAISV